MKQSPTHPQIFKRWLPLFISCIALYLYCIIIFHTTVGRRRASTLRPIGQPLYSAPTITNHHSSCLNVTLIRDRVGGRSSPPLGWEKKRKSSPTIRGKKYISFFCVQKGVWPKLIWSLSKSGSAKLSGFPYKVFISLLLLVSLKCFNVVYTSLPLLN